ncbi:MAG: ElyC/SanA/YdcF family protein [Puia sp.]|nr:ElyC/SanA/YdcF family protein [Puia sp.]
MRQIQRFVILPLLFSLSAITGAYSHQVQPAQQTNTTQQTPSVGKTPPAQPTTPKRTARLHRPAKPAPAADTTRPADITKSADSTGPAGTTRPVDTTQTAQTVRKPVPHGFNPYYKMLRSGNWIVDKNFYLLTVIAQDPEVSRLLQTDSILEALGTEKRQFIHRRAIDTITAPMALLSDLELSGGDMSRIIGAITFLYDRHPAAFDRMIDRHLRPSGCYQRYIANTNKDFLFYIWAEVIVGINHIIDQYGLDRNRHYPSIDAVSYDIHGEYYRTLLKNLFSYLDERIKGKQVFYHYSLTVALELLKANNRLEASNYEPLSAGENRLAIQRIPATPWKKYPYAAIMVPGEGPEIASIAFDPIGRMRCELAAERYHKGQAPFIIVSGGNVHPFHTPYTEALEMKKFLVRQEHIPESAILLEPQARHTTTNFRNANRLAIRYGFPSAKPFLCVTTKDQADYIMATEFDDRNNKELGYLPYEDKKRLSVHEISYQSALDCLQSDPRDPLDP